jgi:hypothetical protein
MLTRRAESFFFSCCDAAAAYMMSPYEVSADLWRSLKKEKKGSRRWRKKQQQPRTPRWWSEKMKNAEEEAEEEEDGEGRCGRSLGGPQLCFFSNRLFFDLITIFSTQTV